MRLFRYAVLAAVLAVPVLVISAPAAYSASSAGGSRASGAAGLGRAGGAAGHGRAGRAAELSGGSTAFASPSVVNPGGRVTFTAECSPAANAGGASAVLFGGILGLPQRIPMTAHSSGSFTFSVTVGLPSDIATGTYRPDIDCPGGTSARPTLHVVPFPRGGAATGDGTTATTSNGPLAALGLGLIGIGALTGGFALRRRGARSARARSARARSAG